jgi:hypothetical protein
MDVHLACRKGDVIKLEEICDKLTANLPPSKKSDFLKIVNAEGLLPLDITVINNHFECCKYLFDTFSPNPLHLNAKGSSAVVYTIDLYRIDFLKLFVENTKRFQPIKLREDVLVNIPCNQNNASIFQCVIESTHPRSDSIMLILLEYCPMTITLRKSLFIGSVKCCNIVLIETVLNYGDVLEDEKRSLVNLHMNTHQNYMKISKISDATTTPLILAIERQDRFIKQIK